MNRLIVIAAFFGAWTCQAYASDKDLLAEISEWKQGSPAPSRLLKFPDGQLPIPMCGMRVWGDSVCDYIAKIKDSDLLAAIIFDGRAQTDSFRAAVSQFVRVKGVNALARLVVARQRSTPSAFGNSELAILRQLLTSPYMAVKVARISKDDMELHKAERVLENMKSELAGGKPWATVYAKFADQNPDMRDRAKDQSSHRTLICYLYDGVVSPTGFDLLTYSVREYLPLEHLPELFRAKQGDHIIKTRDGVYLYHIDSYADGEK
jgi:hypothetical protein